MKVAEFSSGILHYCIRTKPKTHAAAVGDTAHICNKIHMYLCIYYICVCIYNARGWCINQNNSEKKNITKWKKKKRLNYRTHTYCST